MIRNRIPDVVVRRLVEYLRLLKELPCGDKDFISSAELGNLCSVNGAQVRKDLALFGEFGKQGVGYPVQSLVGELTRIIGADREMGVAVFGVGEMGTALVRFLAARKRHDPDYKFVVKALFDKDERKIGSHLEGLTVTDLPAAAKASQIEGISIGIVTVPASAAQEVLDLATAWGIRGFLNFAPMKLRVARGIRVYNADVTLQLQELAFYL